MRREIAFGSALVLAVAALMAGLIGGGAVGTFAGYWLAGRHGTSSSAVESAGGRVLSLSQETNAAIARVNPAVVTVENLQRGSAGNVEIAGVGSGFIIDSVGHIVTNQHVVDGADAVTVVFSDGTKAPATLVGSDQYQDVAVVATQARLPAVASWGDSSGLQPGQTVVAIGSALGTFRNTVSAGVVSGGGRSLDTGDGYRLEHLVQHDAPISPGDSGGPLLDAAGRVVGMNTAIVTGGLADSSTPNLSFAIESDTVRRFASELITRGHIARPYLGVTVQPVRPAAGSPADLTDTEPMPVDVVQVDGSGPAARAGLVSGDEITAVDGTNLDEQHQFLNLVFSHQPGDTVALQVQRGSTQRAVQVTLAEPSTP